MIHFLRFKALRNNSGKCLFSQLFIETWSCLPIDATFNNVNRTMEKKILQHQKVMQIFMKGKADDPGNYKLWGK